MKRALARAVVLGALATVCAAAPDAATMGTRERPNVLVIVVDPEERVNRSTDAEYRETIQDPAGLPGDA